MTDFVTCPSCAARNGADAVWCTMCFEPIGTPAITTHDAQVEATDPSNQPADVGTPSAMADMGDTAEGTGDGAIPVEPDGGAAAVSFPTEGGSTWTCAACETINPMSQDVCSVCGTTIFQTMGADGDEPAITADQGFRLGVVPGLAHSRLGEPVLGLIIGILVIACLAFATLLILSGGVLWGLIVGVVGLITWATSIADVNQRIAGSAPILRPRVITILGGIVILVIMLAGFVAGVTAVRSPGS